MKYKLSHTMFVLILIISMPVSAQVRSFLIPSGPTGPNTPPPSVPTPAPTPPAPASPSATGSLTPAFSTPPCPNSTCITSQTIRNKTNAYVAYSRVRTHVSLILPPGGGAPAPGSCQAPIPSGTTMHRQVATPAGGQIVQYTDAFCMNQGCVYMANSGTGQCQ